MPLSSIPPHQTEIPSAWQKSWMVRDAGLTGGIWLLDDVQTVDREQRHRRSLRLRDFDYAQEGAYFVTICTQDRSCVLGEILDGSMLLNDAGRMVQKAWDDLADHYPGLETDAVVVMPNHLHGVIVLLKGQGPASGVQDPHAEAARGLRLGDVVHRFKSLTTRRFADGVKGLGWPAFPGRLWQRNYFEPVIRDRESLDRSREYIAANPALWVSDSENPNREGTGQATGFLDM